jgi:hypothetical protein
MPEVVTAYRGARASEGFRVVIPRADSGIDLSTVVSVSLVVRSNSGSESTWSTVIESQSANELTCRHDFAADGSETATVGQYRVTPIIFFSGGAQRRAEAFPLNIVG